MTQTRIVLLLTALLGLGIGVGEMVHAQTILVSDPATPERDRLRPDPYLLRLGELSFDLAAGLPELPAGWQPTYGSGPDLHLVADPLAFRVQEARDHGQGHLGVRRAGLHVRAEYVILSVLKVRPVAVGDHGNDVWQAPAFPPH